jgi:2-methylcitrate dehydratase
MDGNNPGEIEEQLIDFADQWTYSDLSEDEISFTKKILLDGFACTLEGSLAQPTQIITGAVIDRDGSEEASIIGSEENVSLGSASLANGVMIRNYDYSDTVLVPFPESDAELPVAGCHPSEHIPSILATSEYVGADGEEFVAAVALSYELTKRFLHAIDGASYSSRGSFKTALPGVVIPSVVGDLLDLSKEEIASAMGIAGSKIGFSVHNSMSKVPNTMTKSFSVNEMAASAVFGTRLASNGYTGPRNILTCNNGFFDEVYGSTPETEYLTNPDSFEFVTETLFKLYPVNSASQGVVHSLMELLTNNDLTADEIDEIDVHVSSGAFSHSSDPKGYFQVNEESADHSLRYSCSVACLDQEVTTVQYRNERYTDPDVVEFSKKLNFHEDESYNSYLRPGRVRIRLDNGDTLENETLYPPGDIEKEVTFEQLREKVAVG